MSNGKKLAKNFALQATILAIASIGSKIIGMLYNIPFANILKTSGEGYGNGYYGAAQTWYFYILIIATFSIPSAVSKIMAEHIAKGQYKNVKRIFQSSMIYVFIVGILAAALCYFAAPFLVTENAVFSLRVMAPTIFFSGFLSVYRGYFQSYGDMVPTSLSQLIEQVFNAIGSIVMALLFIKWATAMGKPEDVDKFGAAGGTIGTGIGLLAGLIYMLVRFMKEKPELNQRIAQDKTEHILSHKEAIKLLLTIATPIIVSAAIYNVNASLDMTIFQKLSAYLGHGKEVIDGQYGLYSRMYLVLANVPIAMASAVASAVIPTVSSAYSSGNQEECNNKLIQALQLTMVMAVPCAFGFAVLGKPIVRLLYFSLDEQEVSIVGMLLLLGGISIIVYGISSVLNGVLQGIGKVNVPVISALVALVLHVLLLVPLIWFHVGIYSLIFATAFYAIVVVILNYLYLKKELQFIMKWKTVLGVPVVSATIMGVLALVIYKGVMLVSSTLVGARIGNAIALLVAIGVAIIVYFATMIKVGGYNEEMLMAFPKGHILVKFARKMKLIK